MASPSYTYTLTNGTTADATQVMQNFNDILNGVTDGSKDLSISALTAAGTATLNGNINLGNASGDDLSITASLASSLAIKTTNTYAIGSSSLVLSNIFSTLHSAGAGSASAPAFEFTGDPNSGIYSVGADDVGISAGGTLRFDVSTTAITSTIPHLNADGAVGTPAYSFSGDTDTGMYRIGANDLGFATNGVLNLEVTAANGTKIRGSTTNDAAAAGFVGEYISSTVAVANVPAQNASYNLTSISLTAGDWLVGGAQHHQVGTGTFATGNDFECAITSTTTGSGTDGDTNNNFIVSTALTGLNQLTLVVVPFRVSLASTTTYYLTGYAKAAAGTTKAGGRISAWRLR